MSWAAALATILKALEPYLPQLVSFLAGSEWQKDHQAAKDLKSVENANRAAAGVDALPDDDVVQQLKKRGMYRLPGK
ncbi:hypothetical protein EN866_19585 [Mesorhizobium sp. M2D.F.Ca.ET.223.01.1.1]|uniref:hypothetical protein n=1 Tax=unclassified Mesorhizobium TaxID=325217 RepID=UPI000FCAC6E6|nr:MULTISPECIES: hypothetical protein [unclassified Mesorhizobium]TGP89364.1 hypothetical protein EN864_19595 [bacterium M00.F.Ca.ET.221.01.1.1]TGP94737.1 hypothetical protein EN865_15465 [bacterium M00.F.Ca.ET.222.01.1.1]RVD58849.1 hypothetical protein EN783_14530 [Mesorhizobium sp. M2D.F.Ca.ET.140.01.1.1]TGP27877.1 hypothetical protein EN875_033010 [Mesorhizobium sp. M2D.F.Ca.ET.232.01.1.1]TGP75905.1 hypothetical protein EN867_15465 [Mesorhizobium sp. M2D.F.Ca.ET.224.01.1.1]